jgi:hypothetical protein
MRREPFLVYCLSVQRKEDETRPTKCSYCRGNTFQNRGKVRKRVLRAIDTIENKVYISLGT